MAFPPESPQRSLHPPDLHLHLCKLRKALTCFICHQLLQKPACLHCNHHFCTSCLLHSMEEMSACPKCKQPAATRQARFAPEMDALVEIYQNLENAAGPMIANSDDSQLDRLMEVKSMAFNVKVEDECLSPSAIKRQRRHENRERVSNTAVDATEADSRKRDASSLEVPCRGILPASKRIQLACPPLPVDRSEATNINLDKTNVTFNNHSALESLSMSVDANASLGKQETVFAHARIGGQSRTTVFPNEGKVHLPADLQAPELHHEQLNMRASIPSKRNDHPARHPRNVADGRAGFNADQSSRGQCGPDKQADIAAQLGSTQAQDAAKNAKQNGTVLNLADQAADKVTCAFCHKADAQVAGPMIHYKKGIAVSGSKRSGKIVSVHKNCAEWAPGVYFEDDVAKNIPQEIARGHKIKCHVCGLRGAVLGCYVKRCRKSFHFPCAHTLSCRWDDGNFLVFCPEHVGSRFPDESATGSSSKLVSVPNSTHKEEKARQESFNSECKLQNNVATVDTFTPSWPVEIEDSKEELSKRWAAPKWPASPSRPVEIEASKEELSKRWAAPKWPASQLLELESCKEEVSKWPASKFIICGSGLSPKANDLLATFMSCTEVTYEKSWTSSVTHLIAGTDEVGAARRTYKYLMANLEGKWILKVDWLSACMAADRYVNEEPYEVNLDIHGMIGGPRRARGMAIAKAHGLFEGLSFHFLGEFAAAYRADLQALLSNAGGEVLSRMPDASGDTRTCTVVIYSKDIYPDTSACLKEELNRSRYLEAKSFAAVIGANVAAHTWILDSVAAYELQPFE